MLRLVPLRFVLTAALAAPAPSLALAHAADDPFAGELELRLSPAADQPKRNESGPGFFIHLEARDGQWRRPWAKGVGIFEHTGLVDSVDVTDTAMRLKLRLAVEGDFWVKGRWLADYEIELSRDTGGALAGTYKGRYGGEPVAGVVAGRILPPRPVREGFTWPGLDEHPRVLLRRCDLPRLRKKLGTPLGQAYLKQASASGDLISLGMLYQLTGEKSWAARAMETIRAEYLDKDDGRIPVYGFGSGGFGHEVFKTALAYDLCFDAWPKDFRDELRLQFEEFIARQQRVLMTSHANYHPCSNYYGPGRGVPGVVSMILWGDRGPMPRPPRDPVAQARPLVPPKGFAPGAGVTVTDLVSDRTPQAWIWSGPVPFVSSRDLLHEMGGYGKATPQIGSRATYATQVGGRFSTDGLEFRAIPDGVVSERGIEIGRLFADDKPSASVFFTALRVQRSCTVAPVRGSEGVRIWLSGVELEDNSLYQLQPGVHAMTVELRTRHTTGVLSPRLLALDHESTHNLVGLYNLDRDLWQQDHDAWKETGMLPIREFWLQRGWMQNYQHYRLGVGDGGFMAETGGYAQISSWYPSVYASMYPSFHGRKVSAHPDVAHIIPRQIMQSVFPAGGSTKRRGQKPVTLRLNSTITLNPQWIACHYPIIPDAYKPSALWVWNYLMGVTDDASIPRVMPSGKESIWGLGSLTAAQTFLHYPLDVQPVHPREGMPRDWRADTFGLHVFRSGFEAGDEFVAQVFGKTFPIKGWNHPNAGSFQVWGLGHAWSTTDDSPGTIRDTYSIVLLPDEQINAGATGRLVHRRAFPDGSGSITFDLGDVYARRRTGRQDEAQGSADIKGLRAFAFDYSGKSGAPALMVIVDRIEGGGRRLWTWQKPDGAAATVNGNGFTISYPDASMKATFVLPASVKPEYVEEKVKEGADAKHGFWGTLRRIKAHGRGSFFVVITFQRDEAPPVKVEGEGLEATVKVGGQTVRFDGTKVLLGGAVNALP